MTTLQEKLRSNGAGCHCYAYSASECSCDATWAENHVLEAADHIDHIESLIRKLHAAKGRYHTQLACCDLFDALQLKNERPKK